jgi:outer membrane protein
MKNKKAVYNMGQFRSLAGKLVVKAACLSLLLFILFSMHAAADTGSTEEGMEQSLKKYSLKELYRLGMLRSEEIMIAENLKNNALKDEDRAFSVLVPQLSGFGNYIRYSESSTTQPEYGYEYGVKLQQQFTINGRELILYKAAKDATEKSDYDLETAKEYSLFNIASAYYDIVNKLKRVEIFKSNVERLKAHRDAIITKLELEEVPRTDLLRTEAELSGASTELVVAENQVIIARSTLARLVELPQGYDLELPAGEEVVNISGGLESFIETAYHHRSDMKSTEMDIVLADRAIDLSKSEYWPVLGFEAGYKYQETDPSYLSSGDTLYGALNLDMVFFDWGFRKATIAQDKAKKHNAELQLKLQKKQIALEVEQAYLTTITVSNEIKALRDKLAFSKANYDAVSLQFDLGQADILDIMDANTTLVNSERELSEAQYLFVLAKISLQRAQGIFLMEVENLLAAKS